jgi:HD-like signal output (HDOD) protein
MTPVIAEEAAQQLLKGITVPPQPQIMVDLQMEMLMPDVSMDAIIDIIAKDVGLSGCVLKVVNSPFFGLRNKITSIHQALSLLGFANVTNIVNSLSIRSSLSDSSIVDMTQFWDNSIDVALACAAISRLTGVSPADEAYSLGLFHNAGIPLLISKFDRYSHILNSAYADPKRRITEVENQAIDTNHAVVGYFVAKTWKLPSYIYEAIADHHKTEDIFADKLPCDKKKKNLLATLKLAETICKTYKTLGSVSRDYEFERIKSNLLIYIGLSEYDFEDLQAELIDMGLNQGGV